MTFTTQALHVLRYAREDARRLGHPLAGTGHLLLGLLHDERSIGTYLLAGMGMDPDRVRTAVCAQLGPATAPSGGGTPFTPQALDVVNFFSLSPPSCAAAYISGEHLLFALLTESDGTAAKVLGGMGLDLEAARRRVLPLLTTSRRPFPVSPTNIFAFRS